MSEFRDVYAKITNRIVADLEQGVRPWMRPWSVDHAAGRITRPLRHNGIPYKGINVLMLWSASVAHGYACPIWLTFKQALEVGGNVRKGEHGELVVYANRITRTETGDNGEETEREIPFLKGYTVFNAEQCEGLPAHYTAKAEPPALPQAARLERADAFFAATGADIRHGGTKAFYAHGPDYARYLDSLHRPSIELGGLVQVANRRDPRATRSALTSDGAARVGGACLPTWASLGMGVRGKGANGLWMTLRVLRRPLSRSRSAERRQVSTATFRSF